MNKNDITILYVEDEENVRVMLSRFLQRFCSKLIIAENGQEGLELYKKNNPDIVISDIKMPKMNGLDMAKEIKQLNHSQLILLLTAHSDSEFLYEAINIGIDGYILKPIDLDVVNEKLKNLIDIVVNRQAAQKLKESAKKLKLLSQALEQMDEMVTITDTHANIIYTNPATLKQTQYKEDELLGQNIHIFKSGKHSEDFYKKLWQTILSGRTYKNIFLNKKKDGTLYYDEQTISPMKNESGDIRYFISTSRDITKRIALEDELKYLATKDALTGIYNRYKINTIIEDEIKRANRYNEVFSLIMFDIDKFKNVNDTYGHDAGDSVLQELSHILSKSIRETDSFGRWGGEEFMLIAPNTDKEKGLKLAQKIRQDVENHIFEHVKHITISVGISQYIQNENTKELIKRVDTALYQAKENGRNQVVFL